MIKINTHNMCGMVTQVVILTKALQYSFQQSSGNKISQILSFEADVKL